MSKITSDSEYDNQNFVNISLRQSIISRIEFQSCTFEKCDLAHSTLTECRFLDCTFQGCDLSLMKPNGSSFTNCTFKTCKLVGINWLEASKQFSVDFDDCIINLSSFFGINLKRRKITNCIAHEVDFTESNMTECDCNMTDFNKSIFSRTNLTKANLKEAINYSIDFRSNTLTKTKFSLPDAMSLLDFLDIVVSE
jgi:fluoroquinolone resistance protein